MHSTSFTWNRFCNLQNSIQVQFRLWILRYLKMTLRKHSATINKGSTWPLNFHFEDKVLQEKHHTVLSLRLPAWDCHVKQPLPHEHLINPKYSMLNPAKTCPLNGAHITLCKITNAVSKPLPQKWHILLSGEWTTAGCQEKAKRDLKNKSWNSAQSQSASSPHKGSTLSLCIDGERNREV